MLPRELVHEIYYLLPARDRRALRCVCKDIQLPEKIEWVVKPHFDITREYTHNGERLFEGEINALTQLACGNNTVIDRTSDANRIALIAAYYYHIRCKSVCVILTTRNLAQICAKCLPAESYLVLNHSRQIKSCKINVTHHRESLLYSRASDACDTTIAAFLVSIPGALSITASGSIKCERYDPPRVTIVSGSRMPPTEIWSPSLRTIVIRESDYKKARRYISLRCNGPVTLVIIR